MGKSRTPTTNAIATADYRRSIGGLHGRQERCNAKDTQMDAENDEPRTSAVGASWRRQSTRSCTRPKTLSVGIYERTRQAHEHERTGDPGGEELAPQASQNRP